MMCRSVEYLSTLLWHPYMCNFVDSCCFVQIHVCNCTVCTTQTNCTRLSCLQVCCIVISLILGFCYVTNFCSRRLTGVIQFIVGTCVLLNSSYESCGHWLWEKTCWNLIPNLPLHVLICVFFQPVIIWFCYCFSLYTGSVKFVMSVLNSVFICDRNPRLRKSRLFESILCDSYNVLKQEA